jgi:hypothetical protein
MSTLGDVSTRILNGDANRDAVAVMTSVRAHIGHGDPQGLLKVLEENHKTWGDASHLTAALLALGQMANAFLTVAAEEMHISTDELLQRYAIRLETMRDDHDG